MTKTGAFVTNILPYLVSTYTSVSKDLTLLREAEEAERAVHEEARKIQMQSDSV